MPPARAPARLLIVEQDDSLRELLSELLTEEGYEVQAASDLEEATRLLDQQVFQLVLADLFIGRSPHAFTQGHLLRRRAHPTPVGLLTTQNVLPEEATRLGFVFLLREPFELDDLLALVAQATNLPLSPAQTRLAVIVWSFFAALDREDWEGIASICTEDLTYTVPAHTPFAATRKTEGLNSTCRHLEAIRRNYPGGRFSAIMIFARPRGLAARYQFTWSPPDTPPQQIVVSTLFRFRGERIAHIGNSMNVEHLLTLVSVSKIG